MNDSIKACLAAACLALPLLAQGAETLTIATVNNNDMIRMQRLSKVFEESHPDISLKWVVLEENVLRQRLTTDIATQGGQFDLLTIGMYEAALWGAKGWLEPMSGLPADYALDDLLPSVRDGLSVKGTLYALPFYAEASITYYRKDLFQQAGLRMPEQPTWTQLGEFAARLNRPAQGQYGICLRGKAGWGENMALIGTLANAFGARWFDERWQPEFSGGEWKKALDFYVSTLKRYGPPGASSNGFNENLALFNSGKCALWVDASVAGSFVTDKSQSKVADATGFAFAPREVTDKGASWLYSWALAIPASSRAKDAAKAFATWATSQAYGKLVADREGVANVPPGTRASTYSEAYLAAAPFARVTLESLKRVDPNHPTLKPVPYVGIQLVTIPEFQAIGTQVGKLFSAALTGQMSSDQALAAAQQSPAREMKRAGYPK
ncbi:sugar ABC transporter substrate-binding protein [Pseudomonas aeruginosa]|nr:sugar ABC transporter substrate-binding protein [Pseudomonas aeruginosa]